MNFPTLIAAAVAGCFLGSAALAGDNKDISSPLGGEEIKGLFPGNFEAKVSGYQMLILGSDNGNLQGHAFRRQDKGRWWVKDDALCVSWKQWTSGKPMCGAITRRGEWYFSRNKKGEAMQFRKVDQLTTASIKQNSYDDFDDTP